MIDTLHPSLQLWRDRGILLLFTLLLLIFPISLLVVAFHLIHGSWNWTASVVIALHMMLILLGEMRARDRGVVLLLAGLIGAGGMIVEYVGSTTGVPFGPYWYTGDLRFLVAGVPLAMGAAWITTTFATYRIADHIVPQGGVRVPVVAFMAALLTVAFDIVLEPAAAFVSGYWVWGHGSVPVQNYLAWFMLSFLFVLIIALARRRVPRPVGVRRISYAVFLMQWGMFTVTCLLHGYFLEAAVSILALGFLGSVYTPWRTGTSVERPQ